MDIPRIENFTQAVTRQGKKIQKGQVGFAKYLKGAINRVDSAGKEADRSVVDLMQGKAGIDEAMIALQKADISMRLLLTIRNKVVDAYREIMHMQL